MDPNIRQIKAAREGSSVRRCHTTPHHGEYTVGKHSFDALCLLMFLHPAPSMNLVKAVMFHDLGERWVGDMPATAKMLNERLGAEYEEAEQRALESNHIFLPRLDFADQNWLNAVDKLELYLWCLEQLMMGNHNIDDYVTVLHKWFDAKAEEGKLPNEVQRFLNHYTTERLKHEGAVR